MNSNFRNSNVELDTIFKVLGNEIKRTIVLYIGRKGKVKGGSKSLVDPVVEMAEEFGMKFNHFTIPPQLSFLKNTDRVLEQDENGFWRLNNIGLKAYKILEYSLSEQSKKQPDEKIRV